MLVEESACHSLWVIVRSGGRSWYHLAVTAAADDEEAAGPVWFTW